jgi:hypothetical protein
VLRFFAVTLAGASGCGLEQVVEDRTHVPPSTKLTYPNQNVKQPRRFESSSIIVSTSVVWSCSDRIV